MVDSVSQVEKERYAVDLGPATALPTGTIRPDLLATANPATFAPKPGPFAHALSACDDCVFAGLPIGFSFKFYGNTYTTFSLSTNGFIGFSPGMSSGCCWGRTIPSDDGINNIIAAAWSDLDPTLGGGIFYETRGQAPNRYLIVEYQDVPWYYWDTSNRVTTQIVLYETSNNIDIHTTDLPAGHYYTQGVEDANGALAAFLPGRVSSSYALTDDAVRFTTYGHFWTEGAPLPSGRTQVAAAATGGTLYVIGGLNSAGASQSNVFAYRPSSNAWSTKAQLPAARYGIDAAAISGTIYVAGGQGATKRPTQTLYAYSSATNTWTTRAAMPVASGCGGSDVISGKLYVFSGCTLLSTGQQVSASLLHRYDPVTNRWTTLRAAPETHYAPVVVAIGNVLYVAGGIGGSGVATRRVDVYYSATNTWSTGASMPAARIAAAGAGIGGLLYLAGGRTETTYTNTFYAYNPATNSWSRRNAMPTARAGLSGSLISANGRFYAIGGRNGSTVLTTNQYYTP